MKKNNAIKNDKYLVFKIVVLVLVFLFFLKELVIYKQF